MNSDLREVLDEYDNALETNNFTRAEESKKQYQDIIGDYEVRQWEKQTGRRIYW